MSLRVPDPDRSVTKNILYGPKLLRSIYCHMTLSAMNYLLYIDHHHMEYLYNIKINPHLIKDQF